MLNLAGLTVPRFPGLIAKMPRLVFAIGALALLSVSGAQARPRDDVMAQLFHCNGLESDREWLDCYYGAAQPVRASLGLMPALPAQVRLAHAPIDVSADRPSTVRSRVVADAGRCYDQDSEQDWLNCYYRAALPMRQQLGLSVPPGSQLASANSANKDANIDSLAAGQTVISRMAGYSFDTEGIFTVTLENGQVWRQIDGDSHAAFWKKPANAYLVTIRHGMSGSFILTIRNESRVYRVHRVK